MKRLIQTRLHSTNQKGNCFATAMACFLDLDSPEDYPQVQERSDFLNGGWASWNFEYLDSLGWEWGSLAKDHKYDGYYMAHGISPRGISHVCIYKNGKLWHDPHPSGEGLVSIRSYHYLEYIG